MTFLMTQKQALREARIGRWQQTTPMLACVIGGNGYTVTYNDPDDPTSTLAGRYDATADMNFPYPGQPHLSIIDLSSVRIFADDVLLRLCTVDDIEPVGDKLDSIQATDTCFRTNTRQSAEYPRSQALRGRDCEQGDLIELSSESLGQRFRAEIRGFRADKVDAAFSTVVYGRHNTIKDDVSATGEYTGSDDTQYIIRVVVTEAGPRLLVTTATGTDMDMEVAVEGRKDVPIGTKGVVLRLLCPTLVDGDIFYAEARAGGAGDIKTLLLSRNAPFQLLQADDLTLAVYIKKHNIELAELIPGGSRSNYTVDDNGVTIKSGLHLLEMTCVADDEPVPLPVIEADIHVEYRTWLADMAERIGTVTNPADIEDIPGDLQPANELKWAVSVALENSGASAVRYIAVTDPDDLSAWQTALSRIAGEMSIYGIVPLTREAPMLDAVKEHIRQQSAPQDGRERVMWMSAATGPMAPVNTADNSLDGTAMMAVVAGDDDNDDYLVLTVPGGNACFMSTEVRPGDIARYHYSEDSYGNAVYDEYVVAEVIHEESLRILVSADLQLTDVAQRLEIWRVRTHDAMVEDISGLASQHNSNRVRVVWPDRARIHDVECEGWHLCAALAGLRSAILPQQDLTGVELLGVSDVSRSDDLFSGDQLDMLADSGIFVVAWNLGSIAAMDAVTTAQDSDPHLRDEAVVANLDSINKQFKEDMAEYFGKTTGTTPTMEHLRIRLQNRISELTTVRVHRLGGQLIAGTIATVRRHAFMPGRLVITADLTISVPGRRGLPPSDSEIKRQVLA